MARKPHKYHYIYKTTCKINGKYYVGMHSTSNLEDGYIGSGKRLWNSIKKHGRENHSIEILEWFQDRSSLKDREREIVNEEMIQDPMCMNLVIGGGGGFIDENHRRKFLNSNGGKFFANRLKADEDFFKKHSEISSERMKNTHRKGKIRYDTFLGKTHTREAKDKIGKSNSVKQKGSGNSQYGKMWITNGKENKKIKKEDKIPEGWIKGRKLH